MPLPGFT